jgi:hypothetical protein
MPIANQCDPHLRLQHIRIRLCDVIAHLRADIRDLEEPQLRAVFESSAEVLADVVATLDDYAQGRAPAPRPQPRLRKSG